MSDPLNEALKEATLAVLLGSTNVPVATYTPDGQYASLGTVTLASAFVDRLRSKAMAGEFDDLLREAMGKIDVQSVATAIEGLLAERFLEGLKKSHNSWGSSKDDDWLQRHAKEIATEACTAALSQDEELIDHLRQRIGMEVDRNRINLTVQLSDPES